MWVFRDCKRSLDRADQIVKKWIRTCGVEGRVRKGEDVLVFGDWKPLYLAEIRVFQLLLQPLQEVCTPSLVVWKRHAEALDRSLLVVRYEGLLAGLCHRSRASVR